jgi:B12-binding domain/radical SAM domain protein
MTLGRDGRPLLAFRKNRGNRYTLPVLLGCIEREDLTRHFSIFIADSPEDIVQKGRSQGAIIAFSFMTPNLGQVREEVEKLRKNLSPNSLFLAGGSHASGDPEGTFQLGFDFVFVGESERTFPEFLRKFLSGRLPSEKILRDQEGLSLSLSYPPHSLEQRLFSPIEITRGCLYGCTFCQTPRIFGHPLRHRSPENVARVLKKAIPNGYFQSKFISPNAFSYGAMSRKGPHLPSIQEFLGACLAAEIRGIHFGCYPSEVRPDWVNPEVLELIRKYCRNRTVVLGAQSGSNSLLAKLKRGHTADDALKAVSWIRQAGFLPHVDFVFGSPEETREDRQATLSLMEEMIQRWGAKIHAHTFLPLPGTPLFQKEPTPLDGGTRNSLLEWEKRKKLDGWWKEHELMAWRIVEWRDRGWIRLNQSTEQGMED